MKTIFFTILFSLIAWNSTAQLNQLVLENVELGEIHILEDNQNVRVVSEDGKKYTGKMVIVDEKTIQIKDHLIPLEHIWKIKKHSRIISVLAGIVIVYVSVVTLAAGILIATYGGEVALGVGLGIVGGLGTYGGINGINLSRAYKSDQGWTFRTVAQPFVPEIQN